jgi:hypothetical protein
MNFDVISHVVTADIGKYLSSWLIIKMLYVHARTLFVNLRLQAKQSNLKTAAFLQNNHPTALDSWVFRNDGLGIGIANVNVRILGKTIVYDS